MNIPKKFTIFGQAITVEVVESLDDNEYGKYNDALERIMVAKTVKADNKVVKLSQVQIESTFLHEVIHAIQWRVKGEFDETEAASYSNALIEIIRTGGLRIDPNEVIKEKPVVYDD